MTYEIYEADGGGGWGVCESNGAVLYEADFCKSTAERVVQIANHGEDTDWDDLEIRLTAEGRDLRVHPLKKDAE